MQGDGGSGGADRRDRLAWTALGAVLAIAAVGTWLLPGAITSFDWRPQRALGEPWRLWSAAFVHWSGLHLAANLAGDALVVAFGLAARVPRRSTIAWLAAWPLTHALLAFEPGLSRYGGLSGVLHAGVAVAALHLVVAGGRRGRRAVGALVLGCLAIKVIGEAPWAAAMRHLPGWDIAVAPLAHATGLAAGLVACAVAELVARRRRSLRSPA